MNSLKLLSGYCRTAAIALILTTILSAVAVAQRTDSQSQGRMYGDAGFRGEPINLNVVNADIRDILNYITEQYDINFVIDKSVKSVPVTVTVKDVPWNIALDSILRAQELGVQVNGTILRVADAKTLATEGEIFRQQRDNQIDASPLYTEFIKLNYASAGGATSGGGGNQQTTAGTSSNLSPTASASTGGGVSGGGLLGIIRRRLSRRGGIEIDARTNTLIITDVRENIDAIRQLVVLLDQPEPQVEIEARIVIANRGFTRDIGFQLNGIVVGNGRGAIGGTLPNVRTDLPIPTSQPNPGISNGLQAENATSVLSLTTGIFGTAQISALLTAAENKNQAKVIATPRVTALNNRPAEIKSGTKIPVTTVQPGAGGEFAVATTEYIDVPLRLAITPQITDVGTVVLNVVAENSSLAQTVGNVAPAIDTQSTTTQVTVPDGGTTVIGGVLLDNEGELINRTPGLGSIPILKNLFRRKRVNRTTQEIIFFITPRIVRPDMLTGTPGEVRPRTTTIIQPVPLGNPASNSDPVVPTPSPSPVMVPFNPGQPSPASAPQRP